MLPSAALLLPENRFMERIERVQNHDALSLGDEQTREQPGERRAGAPDPAKLAAFYAVSGELNSAPTLEAGLAGALARSLGLFGFTAGLIALLDPGTGDLRTAAHAGLDSEPVRELAVGLHTADAPGGLAVRRRSTLIVEDLRQSPFAESRWGRAGFRTFVSVPLQSRGMLLGCFTLASDRVRPLDGEERAFLSNLAAQVGTAIANTELYAAAQRKIEYLSALHECSRDLGPAPDLDQVLRLTTERMAQLLRLERTAVLYWDRTVDEVVSGAVYGFRQYMRGLHAPLTGLPAAASVLSEGHAMLSDDAAADGLIPPEIARECGIRSALAVPLLANDRVIGLLFGDRNGKPLRLSADEMDLAMIFANQASVWIASSRLLMQEQQARAEAQTAESKFRDLLELAPDAIMVVGEAGRIRLMNSQAERMFGYEREELMDQPVELLLPERYRSGHVAHREGYRHDPRTRPMGIGLDLNARRKDGSEFPVEISLSPTRSDGDASVISVIRDITDQRTAAREREWLLRSEREKAEQLTLAVREAHHRIKNNLQAISDLLYLELSSADESSAGMEALRESVERIQSIALVHDLLSKDEDVQTVDIGTLAERLVPMVLRSSGLSPQAVTVQLSVPSFHLSSKKATTLALMLNELVSNAAKHAFAGRDGGRLQVRLAQDHEGLTLRVADDGPGLAAGFDLSRNAQVGLQVVRTLAERDLAGKLTFSGGPGLSVEVWFPW